MCGITGAISFVGSEASNLVAEMLGQVQHRGQDGWGIVSATSNRMFEDKDIGLIVGSMTPDRVARLDGNVAIGQVRYATQGNIGGLDYTQPFLLHAPVPMGLVHNGNLTNTRHLRESYASACTTKSDSEVLLHTLVTLVKQQDATLSFTDQLFGAVKHFMGIAQGAYSVLLAVPGVGILAFRDPSGTRPLCMAQTDEGVVFASESVALPGWLGYSLTSDVQPGEAVLVQTGGTIEKRGLVPGTKKPCAFEFIYLARRASVIDGVSVHQTRVRMGKQLAEHIADLYSDYQDRFDVVLSVPDTSDSCARAMARDLSIEYRGGFDKNSFSTRTFMQPSQAQRDIAVRRKLQPIRGNIDDMRVLIVDDSIVRGTTSRQIVQMIREAGAKEVHMAIASPAIRYPNYYGIALASSDELIACGKTDEQVGTDLGLDSLVFLPVDRLVQSITKDSVLEGVETSCFDGGYSLGRPDYL